MLLSISSVEDHRADLVEGIIKLAFQISASLTIDLRGCRRVVDRDMVVGDPDKVAAVFIMLFHDRV